MNQERLNAELIAAIKQMNADAVRSLLEQGADPNTCAVGYSTYDGIVAPGGHLRLPS